MKTKFFLCIRPPVIETDDRSSYTPVSGKTSGRRNRWRKTVASDRCIGNILEGKPENPVQDVVSQQAHNITSPVSEAHVLKSLINYEEQICLKKLSTISNSGAYMMVSSLFFTMFFGKLFGIVCTLILMCSLYTHDHWMNDVKDIGITENMVAVKWPEKGSPEEYKKRVIMAGLLERKNHYR